MSISHTCCPLDSDGVPSSGWPPCSCAVAWAEPPADEGREPLPLESRVSCSVTCGSWFHWNLSFLVDCYYLVVLLFFVIKYRVQCYRLFAKITALYSERLMQILFSPFRITPRKFDTVPSDDPQSSASATPLTLTKRGTRTSFTFRRIRHEPCCCGEILHTLTLSEEEVHPASLYFLSFPHLFLTPSLKPFPRPVTVRKPPGRAPPRCPPAILTLPTWRRSMSIECTTPSPPTSVALATHPGHKFATS